MDGERERDEIIGRSNDKRKMWTKIWQRNKLKIMMIWLSWMTMTIIIITMMMMMMMALPKRQRQS